MKKPDWIEPFLKSSYQLFIHHDQASHLPFSAWGLHPYLMTYGSINYLK